MKSRFQGELLLVGFSLANPAKLLKIQGVI